MCVSVGRVAPSLCGSKDPDDCFGVKVGCSKDPDDCFGVKVGLGVVFMPVFC